jgi:hypothetical protein
MKQGLVGGACIAICLLILTLGLWPFHAPQNAVSRLKDGDGVQFGDYGAIISSGAFEAPGAKRKSFCSLEICLQAALPDNQGTILSFYDPLQPPGLSLHQSGSDLLIEFVERNPPSKARTNRIYIDGVFRKLAPLFLTISSDISGTSVYLNGTRARHAPQVYLRAEDCTGRLILGDAPLQQNTWQGQVRGLALYYSGMLPEVVLRHQKSWAKDGRPTLAQEEDPVGLYLFDERTGSTVHNHAGLGSDLTIPSTYTVLDQIFLEPFWEEFNMSWGYWKNALKNVIGFVPVGFCFYAYLSEVRRSRNAVLWTVLLGLALSLSIEVSQAFLPTRQSGTTDIITNTLGTWIGAVAYQPAMSLFIRVFPWLSRFGPSR